MSDSEGGGKKSGYRLEYAGNGRAKCKGPKPCQGTKIEKGEFRMGSLVDFQGHTSFAWRHWGCTTPKIISNWKVSFDEADDLDGFEDLKPAEQQKVRQAWTDGHVADEDIPESARKEADAEEVDGNDEDEEDEKPKKGKKAAAKGGKKDASEPTTTAFKFEYASTGRAKCKECSENIGKGYLRLGHEVDFRGNKSFAWQHFGCAPTSRVAQLVQSYDEPKAVEGFGALQSSDQERVQRAWEEGAIPEDDKGLGEPVEAPKKKAAPRKKKTADDDEPPKKRVRKAKKGDDDDDDADMDEEEEKPKPKRGAKKIDQKKEVPAKKRAPRQKKVEEDDDEDGEDFGDELANVSGDDDEPEEEEEDISKKRKRAPAKASSSKTSAKPASKATSKPPSKRAAKPTSSRAKKQIEEDYDDE